jgi:hypothetical protein
MKSALTYFGSIVAWALLCMLALPAHAADYALTPNSTAPQEIHVLGAFVDNASFTVPAAGDWSFKVASVKSNAGCSTRYCMGGTYYGRVDSVQLQTGTGTAIVDLPAVAGTYPTYALAITLQPGDYRLRIVGAGAGTIKHIGSGWYFVTSTAPKEPAAISCDYLRDLLQTEGYDDATIETLIDGYRSQTPPVCVGD